MFREKKIKNGGASHGIDGSWGEKIPKTTLFIYKNSRKGERGQIPLERWLFSPPRLKCEQRRGKIYIFKNYQKANKKNELKKHTHLYPNKRPSLAYVKRGIVIYFFSYYYIGKKYKKCLEAFWKKKNIHRHWFSVLKIVGQNLKFKYIFLQTAFQKSPTPILEGGGVNIYRGGGGHAPPHHLPPLKVHKEKSFSRYKNITIWEKEICWGEWKKI